MVSVGTSIDPPRKRTTVEDRGYRPSRPCAGYHESVSALPVDLPDRDPLDPEQILRDLPETDREAFLAQYREALEGARDPAGWKNLRRILRLWRWMAIAASRPGHYEAQAAALAGTGGGMLLEDYIRLRRGA
jgi:uncharacterized protein DUF6247